MNDLNRNSSSEYNSARIVLPSSHANLKAPSQDHEKTSFALYCRSAYKNKLDIEKQIRVLNKYADSKELVVHNVYIDNGYSGMSFQRPGWIKLMADVDTRKITGIIVTDLFRICRNRFDLYVFREYCIQQNIKCISVNDIMSCSDGEMNDLPQDRCEMMLVDLILGSLKERSKTT